MAAVERALEDLVGVGIVLREHVVARYQIARGGVRVAVGEGQGLGIFQHVFDRIDRAVLVRHHQAVIALSAVGSYGLGEDLPIGTIHCFHRSLIAVPGHVDFVETHALDDPSVVRGEEGFDLQAGLLAHVCQEGVPHAFQVLRGLGGDDAEIDFLLSGLGSTQNRTGQQRGRGENATDTFEHAKHS